MQYPITHEQVSPLHIATYALWDGEMVVTVTQHIGANGFFSAAMVVECVDAPMECMMYNGYNHRLGVHRGDGLGMLTMREWIASKLNKLIEPTWAAQYGTVELVEPEENFNLVETL